MKTDSNQTVLPVPRCGNGKILLEAALVVVMGMAFAFAANQISPRGLIIARNYFPTGTNNAVRAVSPIPDSGTTNKTSATASLPPQFAAQLRQAGLQLIDRTHVVHLFHESHSNQNIAFIDARDAEHYQAGHIPGAYEFDPYHPEKYFPVIMPVCQKAQKIVVYCEGGDCDDSETAALLLKDVGIPRQKLFVYGGGFTEWTNNLLPIETGVRNSGKLHNKNP